MTSSADLFADRMNDLLAITESTDGMDQASPDEGDTQNDDDDNEDNEG